jgi:hypothetical protein
MGSSLRLIRAEGQVRIPWSVDGRSASTIFDNSVAIRSGVSACNAGGQEGLRRYAMLRRVVNACARSGAAIASGSEGGGEVTNPPCHLTRRMSAGRFAHACSGYCDGWGNTRHDWLD